MPGKYSFIKFIIKRVLYASIIIEEICMWRFEPHHIPDEKIFTYIEEK